MSAYPVLDTRVIGQAESALGAISAPLLARTGTTFGQWLVRREPADRAPGDEADLADASGAALAAGGAT